MIEGIFGLPGQGKTYEGVRRVLHAADSGRQCYSVTPIDHPNVMLIDYEDIVDLYLPPGLIFLDEVHLVLQYTAWRSLDPKWYEKLSQTRKDGHDLLYTSQNETKVLKQLRDNTNWGWVTNAYLDNFADHPLFFAARCWEMHKIRRGKPQDRYVHAFHKRVARAYDTTYAIRAKAAVKPTQSRLQVVKEAANG